MACSKWIPNVGRKRCTRHFAKHCLSVERRCWKQHNGLLPFSFAIVAAWCCWAISCFMCGTCWAEAGADTGPGSGCAWIGTNPCFSPVPDAKSSLLMGRDFLRDGRWHDKLKHSQKHLEAAGFYFYMDLTCPLECPLCCLWLTAQYHPGHFLLFAALCFQEVVMQEFGFVQTITSASQWLLELSLCSFSFWVSCSPRCILCIYTRTLGTNQLGFHLWYIKKTHSRL